MKCFILKNLLAKRFSSKGLSLSELMLAAGILAFALCGIVALFVNCSGLNEANRNLSAAANHVQFIMEEIRDTSFASIATSISNGTWNWSTSEINTGGLTALSNETITTSSSGTRPLQVTVTAAWQDRTGRERTFSITTLFQ